MGEELKLKAQLIKDLFNDLFSVGKRTDVAFKQILIWCHLTTLADTDCTLFV